MSTIKVDTYQTRGGASEIAIDKLKGVTAAGSMLVVGEGGSTTTNLQQGLCKTWCVWVGDGSAISDSLNVASLTDNTTGDFTIAHANDMASANYHHSGSVIYTAGTSLNATGQVDTQDGTGHRAAATHRVVTRYTNASTNDNDFDFGVATLGTFGDLA